jgi:hypothetical protein
MFPYASQTFIDFPLVFPFQIAMHGLRSNLISFRQPGSSGRTGLEQGGTPWQRSICLQVICQFMNVYGKYYWLVVSTPLKNMKVTWDDYSQYMEK